METKKHQKLNLESNKMPNFMIGFCYVSGLVLASFTYGKHELHSLKEKDVKSQWDYVYSANSPEKKEPVYEIKHIEPQMPIMLDLNQDIKVTDKPIDQSTVIDTSTTQNTNNGNEIVIAPDTDTTLGVKVDEVNDFPDVEAEFPGGYKAWEKYVLDNLVYPEIAIENGECGVVYVTFVIEKDGSVTNTMIRKGVSRYLDQEAKRVIKNSPKWIPGKVASTAVRTSFTITINFEIQ